MERALRSEAEGTQRASYGVLDDPMQMQRAGMQLVQRVEAELRSGGGDGDDELSRKARRDSVFGRGSLGASAPHRALWNLPHASVPSTLYLSLSAAPQRPHLRRAPPSPSCASYQVRGYRWQNDSRRRPTSRTTRGEQSHVLDELVARRRRACPLGCLWRIYRL